MAKKMVLVDPKILETLTATRTDGPPVPDARIESLRKLNHEITEAATRPPETEQHPNDRATELQQLLFQFLKRYDQTKKPVAALPQPPPPPTTTEEIDDYVVKEVMDSVPSSLKKNAQLLLERLKRDKDITWNERGEIIYRGRLINQSNLTDLVNDVLRRRKSMPDPVGWQTFATALSAMNAPKDLIGNPQRKKFVETGKKEEEEAPKKKKKKSKMTTWEEIAS